MDLLIALGVAALLTRVGFALYAVGLVRAKNSTATAMRIVADLCISVLAFWAVGAAILIQTHNQWFWVNAELLFGPPARVGATDAPILFFYTVMVLTASSVVGGAVAERCSFFSLCLVSFVLAAFVLPATCHLAWSGFDPDFTHVWVGWLAKRGFIDFAGGASLHLATGVFAAVAAAMVGPRMGKFNRDGSSSMIPGHNLPIASVGFVILLVGWIPYVGGASTLHDARPGTEAFYAGAAAINVLLATAAAGIATIVLGHFRYGKSDIILNLSGMLGGMVSICAGGALLPPWAAVVTGAVAGVFVPLSIGFIDLRARIDDPLSVIAIHAVGGAWGTLAAGLFIVHPLAMTRLGQIGIQIVGVVIIAAFSAIVAGILFWVLKVTIGLSTTEVHEFEGLDLAEHDIGAYPDFQQNTIRSYDLRET